MRGSGKVVLAVGVYDNADILRECIEWHYRLGIDFAVAYDHGSTDGSQDILAEFARKKLVDWTLISDRNYTRFDPYTSIAYRARNKFAADWIIVTDTDEFVCFGEGGLRDALDQAQSSDITVISMPGFNMTGPPLAAGASAPELLTVRVDKGVKETGEQALSGELPVPHVFLYRPPKTIARTSALIAYRPGGHSAMHAYGRSGELPGVSYLHYPFRGYATFEAKVRNAAAWLDENPELDRNLAWHWRRLVRLHRAGRLREEYDAQFVTPARTAELVRDGVCAIDETVSSWIKTRKP